MIPSVIIEKVLQGVGEGAVSPKSGFPKAINLIYDGITHKDFIVNIYPQKSIKVSTAA